MENLYLISGVIEDEVEHKLAAMLAITAKGSSEGWEPIKEYTATQLLDVYRLQYGSIEIEKFLTALKKLTNKKGFSSTLRLVPGELGERFYSGCSREIVVIMLDSVGRVPCRTIHELWK